jgi:hypothetical protein
MSISINVVPLDPPFFNNSVPAALAVAQIENPFTRAGAG